MGKISVSQRIPNLLGGYSQQPDSLKLPGQLTRADNCIPDPTYGLLKRPGLKLISALTGATNDGVWFNIIRDSSEKYIGQFAANGTIRIWDAITGAAETVNTPTAAATSYISGVSKENFEMLQINDYNFVLNRSKTVNKLSTVSPARDPEAIVVVMMIGYDAKFEITLDGTPYSFTTSATGIVSIDTVVDNLASAIPATYTVTKTSNVIHIKKADNSDFTIEARGGLSSGALLAYKGNVPDVSKLPGACLADIVMQVQDLTLEDGADYYVKFIVSGSGTTGAGYWEETIKPGIETYIDPDTMPHVIIRESNGSFTYRSLNEADKAGDDLYWVERRVGSDDSNPFPTMVGQKITGISFFRNRLVLLSQGNLVCSQPGGYFNLFRVSSLTTTDADAIDISTGSLKPVDMRYAVGDQLGLLIFSEHSQFLLTTEGDAFGPSSAQVKAFSTFTINANVSPVDTGGSIIFTDNNQGFCAVTEMIITSQDNRPQRADLSRTSPNFVPANLRSLVANKSATMISFLGEADPTKLHIFKYFNNGNDRVISAWVRWALPGQCLLQAADHDTYYFVTNQENGICLSTCSVLADVEGTAVNSSGVAFEYRLDLFKSSPSTTYDATSEKTKVYFPAGTYDSTLTTVIIVDDTTTERGSLYVNPTIGTDGSGTYAELPKDRTGAHNITIGYQYTLEIGIPRFYKKESLANGAVQSDVNNIPRVQRLVIQSTDSGPFNASVALKGRTTKNYSFAQTPANDYDANTLPLPPVIDNSIPIYGKGTDAEVAISSNTPYPLSFVAATWYGVYNTKGINRI